MDYNSVYVKTEPLVNDEEEQNKHHDIRYPCDQCGYAATRPNNLKVLKENIHQGVRYPCDQYDYAATRSDKLNVHKENIQHGVRYPCDQCEYVGTRSDSLKIHKENIHQVLRYPCDQCDYAATQSFHLKRHKKNIHQGVIYPCDQCEYVATRPDSLDIHKENIHLGVRYPCDQCEYVATRPDSLDIHKKINHQVLGHNFDFEFDHTATQLFGLKRQKENIRYSFVKTEPLDLNESNGMEHLDIKSTEDASIVVNHEEELIENEMNSDTCEDVYSIDIKEELENTVDMDATDMITSENMKDLLFKENNSEIDNLADKEVEEENIDFANYGEDDIMKEFFPNG